MIYAVEILIADRAQGETRFALASFYAFSFTLEFQ